ncbi:MAG: hypothetical protein R3Y61_02440 [Rikenellaceae bacterium]
MIFAEKWHFLKVSLLHKTAKIASFLPEKPEIASKKDAKKPHRH